MRLRDVFIFWLPLLLSWAFMMTEGPVVTALVSRLPAAATQLAAIGVVIGLAVAIESPIIQLLATATKMVRDHASLRVMRRFTWHLMLGLTAVHLLIVMPPLFDLVVRRAMAPPEPVVDAVYMGLAIMVPWSAAIAWRRFLQGVLIRCGRTRPVAWGTGVRLLASAATAVGLALGGALPGVAVGCWALMVGVVVEALFVSLAARRPIRDELPAVSDQAPPSLADLWRFHLPLAGTSMLALAVQPLIAATLARLDRPEMTLAVWPIVFHLTLLTRVPAFALPEVVVALSERGEDAAGVLRRFSLLLTAASLAGMLLLAWTPLVDLYLGGFQGLPAPLIDIAWWGVLMLLPFPALSTLIAWLRGRLIVAGRTAAINVGMAANVTSMTALLGLALLVDGDGIIWVTVGKSVATAAECAALAWQLRASRG